MVLDELVLPPMIRTAEELGLFVYGPMIFRFLAFVHIRVRALELDAIRFVSREGWFLGRLYNVFVRALNDLGQPQAKYFHTSRRCLLAAQQSRAVTTEPELQGAGFNGTVSKFMEARLNIRLPQSDIGDRAVRLPGDEDVVRQALHDFKHLLQREGVRQADGLAAYCDVDGVLSWRRVGLVDIGYSATVQRGLQSLFEMPLHGLYMAVSHIACRTRDQGGSAIGCFAGNDSELRDFVDSFGLLLEAFLTAPHGQVTSYDRDGAPEFREGGLAQAAYGTLEDVYLGVEAYALSAARVHGPEIIDGSFDDDTALQFIRAVVDGRLPVSDELMHQLSVEDDFAGMGEVQVSGGAPVERDR